MVNETAIERHLLTEGLPDPDVLIRTSGEKRVSLLRRLRRFKTMLWGRLMEVDFCRLLAVCNCRVPRQLSMSHIADAMRKKELYRYALGYSFFIPRRFPCS